MDLLPEEPRDLPDGNRDFSIHSDSDREYIDLLLVAYSDRDEVFQTLTHEQLQQGYESLLNIVSHPDEHPRLTDTLLKFYRELQFRSDIDTKDRQVAVLLALTRDLVISYKEYLNTKFVNDRGQLGKLGTSMAQEAPSVLSETLPDSDLQNPDSLI